MTRAADQAYDRIRLAILEGVYEPGDHLPEENLAELADVSRTPVREALGRLGREGFVHLVPNHGARVASWTAEELDEIFQTRALLEGEGAYVAATSISKEDLAHLADLAELMVRSVEQTNPDLSLISRLNAEFHDCIQVATQSRVLNTLLPNVRLLALSQQTFLGYRARDLARSCGHHIELVEAFQAHDGQWARSVMRTHVLAARRVMLDTFKMSADNEAAASDA